MLILLATTTNFNIEYDNAYPNAIKRATALVPIVESEFSVLTKWFNINGGFGPNNRVTVRVNRAQFGGINYGYGGGGLIELAVLEAAPDDAAAAEEVKAFFVAEFVEILMDYNLQIGAPSWNRGHSDGEGLSRLCARERFMIGYTAAFGVEVNVWLNSPRNDFITVADNTDQNGYSIACTLLFLYYLKSQLNFPIPEIIQAGGGTLEHTFNQLTGSNNGYTALRLVIDPFYPPGPNNNATDDDIFPLYDLAHRYVWFSVVYSPDGAPVPLSTGEANVFFAGCGERKYQFQIKATPKEMVCTARAVGFAQPRFSWHINGTAVANANTLKSTCLVSQFDPQNPQNVTTSSEPVIIDYSIDAAGSESSLTFSCDSTAGLIYLNISVDAQDALFQPGVSTTQSGALCLINEELSWEPAYYKDARDCLNAFLNRFAQLAPPFNEFGAPLAVILTLPDPPPPDASLLISQLTRLAFVALELGGINQLGIADEIVKFMVNRYAGPVRSLRNSLNRVQIP